MIASTFELVGITEPQFHAVEHRQVDLETITFTTTFDVLKMQYRA